MECWMNDAPTFVLGEDREWWKDGKRHREGGPAHERGDYYQAWYMQGVLHREDGPAIENTRDHCFAWYRHGVLHRTDGPAVTFCGDEQWWVDGKRHREDGTAFTHLWVDDKRVGVRGVKKAKKRESPRDEKPYLVFRVCKASCYACNECGYFWGPCRGEEDPMVGKRAF